MAILFSGYLTVAMLVGFALLIVDSAGAPDDRLPLLGVAIVAMLWFPLLVATVYALAQERFA